MKKLILSLFVLLMSIWSFGQIAVTVTGNTNTTPNLAASYVSLASALTDLNAVTAMTGPVVFDLAADGTETAPAAGFILGSTTLNAVVTATNTITFQKTGAGANPLITAFTPGTSASIDGIWKIVGTDFVTISSINLQENIANTTATMQMEWGFALVKPTLSDGTQNVNISNCTISLNKTNTASVGIYSGNHIATSTAALTVASASGTNSNIKINGNTISNTFYGIYFKGFADATPYAFYDQNNEIGVTVGNTISNFGSTASCAGIYLSNNNLAKISNNNISTTAVTSTLRGIYLAATTNANVDVTLNTISLSSSATTSQLTGIESAISGTSNTVNLNNNTIQNCTYSTATTGTFYGIYNSAAAFIVNINGNTINNNSTAGIGTFYGIETGSPTTVNVNTNTISNNSKTGIGTIYCIKLTSPTNFISSGNTIEANNQNAVASTGSTYGYYSFSSAVNMTINNNIIRNMSVTGTGSIYGIRNWSAAGLKTFKDNQIYGFTSAAGGSFYGIYESFGSTLDISGNQFYGFASTGGTSSVAYGIYITNAVTSNFYKNKIYNFSMGGSGSSVYGFYIAGGATNNIYNNYVSDLKTPQTSGSNPVIGINLTSTATTTSNNIYYNTIFLNSSSTGINFGTSGIYHTTSTTATTAALDLRNNIIVNTSTPSGTGITAAYRRSSSTLTNYTSTSNNNLFYAGTPSASNLIMYDGTNSYQTLDAYKTAMATRDANSISESPLWVSTTGSDATYLHINTATATGIESGGATIATYSTDFDGDARHATAPDMGADEFAGTPLPLCTGTPAASTINGAASVCSGTGTSLTLSTTYTDLGLTYQWKSATVSGGPYTNMGTSTSQSTSNLAITTYFICEITCTYSALTYITAEKTVTVNTLPTVAVTPTTGSYCTPGGTAVALTASNATTYAWSPSTGLSAAIGTTVDASPSTTTTYTVTGTDGNGCINTATAVITVGNAVTATATATPATICSGGNSQLQVVGNQPYNNTVNGYSFVGSTGTYTAITGTTLGADAIGDDVGIGNLPIGFTFNYNGTNQTVFGARSNGLIELGQTSATLTFFSSNALASTANCIAPLWDDNNTTGGSIIYATTGTAGSRILTVQWTGMHVGGGGSATNPTIDMQVNLYEGTNKVEFIYGSTSAAFASTTASIGISGAVANYLSVTPLSPASTSTTSSVAENTAISSATNLPSGTTYTFTPTPAPVLTYAWSPTTFISGYETTVNPSATAVTTTTTYTATVTGNVGCTGTATATVTVSSGAAISTQPLSDIKCAGQSSLFTVVATGPGLTYQWRKNTTNIDVLANASAGTATLTLTNVASGDAGIYDVIVSSTCGAPVTSDGTSTLTVNPVPTVSASSNTPLCSSLTLNLTGTADMGTAYAWTGPNGFTSTTQSPSISTAATAASGTYSFTATLNGCTSIAGTTVVTINQTPTAVTINPATTSICNGSIQSLVAGGGTISGATIVSDNFNGVSSWTTINNSTGGTPTIAAWTLSADAHSYGGTWHSNDNSQFYLSNSDGQGSGGTTATILQSPSFSTINYTSATVNFYHYFRSTGTAKVEASTDGVAWTTLQTYNSTQGTIAGFTLANIALTAPFLNQTTVYVRFKYDASWGYYWGIDNVSITGTQSTNITWTPNTALYSDAAATSAYAGTAATTVYTKTSADITYTATATSAANCTNTGTTAITVNPIPAAPTAANQAGCFGFSIPDLTATSTGTVKWYNDATLLSLAHTGVSFATGLTAAGVYTYYVTQTVNGCESPATTVTLTINATIPSAPSSADHAVCFGATVPDLTATGSGLLNWYSDAALTTLVHTGTPYVTGISAAGVHTYYVTSTVTGCTSASTTVVLNIRALPTAVATVTGTNPICLNASSEYTVTFTGVGPFSISKNTNIATTPVTENGLVSPKVYAVTPTATTDYNVISVTDNNGCIATVNSVATITVKPLPIASVLSFVNPTTCSGTNGSISVTDNVFFTYTWNSGITQTTSTVTGLSAGSYSVTVSENGCNTILSQALSDPAAFTVSLTSSDVDNTICAGQSVTFTPSGLTTGTYEIFVGGISKGNTTGYTTTILEDAAPVYVIGTQTGCVAQSNTILTTVHALPTPAITGALSYCAGANTSLSTGTYASYSWSSVAAASQSITATTTNNPISVQVTDANGCVGTSAVVNVTVNALPTPAITGTLSYCAGSNTTLSTGVYAAYAWSSIAASSQSITATTANNPISVQVTDANGCIGTSAPVNVTVNALPVPVIAGTLSYCAGANTTLDAGAFASYTWSTFANTQTIQATTAINPISVQVTDANGCIGTSAPVNVSANALPVPVITGTLSYCAGSNTTLSTGTFASYSWSTSSTVQTTVATTTNNPITVLVTDANGCTGTSAAVNVASIAAPAALTATAITANSANLGWTSAGTLFNIEFGPSGFTPTGIATSTGVTNPHTVNALIASTSYSYYVQGDCGGNTSAWSGPYTFTTECNAVSIPYSQNFESTWTTPSTLSCWSGDGIAATQWHRNDYTTGWASASGAYTGTGANSTLYSARFHSYDVSNGVSTSLVTPLIDLSVTGSKKLEYYYRNNSGSDVLKSYLSEDGGTTWNATSLSSNTTASQWTKYVVNVVSSSSTAKIKFTATSDYGASDIGLDEVLVRLAYTAKDILTFNLTTPASTGTITANAIALTVPAGTNVTALVPTITISTGATIVPATGVANDFTTPATYTVTAEDGTTNVYTVTVTVSPLTVAIVPANSTVNVHVNGNITFTYNAAIRNIDNSVIDNTNVASLITFTTPDAAGTAVPFTAAINAGKTVITVTPTSLLAYATNYFVAAGSVEELNNMAVTGNSTFTTMGSADVTAPLVQSAVVENLAPANVVVSFDEVVTLTNSNGFTFTIGGTLALINTVTGSGTNVLTFTLSAPVADHTIVTMDYATVSGNATDMAVVPNALANVSAYPVTNNVLSGAKDILTFAFTNPAINATINGTIITATMPAGTDLTALIPTITLSAYASVNPASGAANNFTAPATYTVTAENGTTKIYTVKVALIQTVPYVQNFEGTFPPTYWNIVNPDAARTWAQITVAGNAPGTKAAYMDFWGYSSPSGQLDDLISPTFDLTNHMPVVTFKVAYKEYIDSNDSLKVFISADGGLTFNATPIYSKGANSLSTAGTATSAFSPSLTTDWRTETIDLSNYTGNNIVLKFQSRNEYGNNLYVDDIKVFDPPTATISGTATICSGQSTDITIALTGTGPWTIDATDGTSPATFTATTSPFVTPASPTATTTYAVISVSDFYGTGTATGSAIVTVNNTPVLTIVDPAAACTMSTVDITAATVITGNTYSGTLTYWTDAAATIALANPTAITTAGTYYIKSTNTCGNDIKPVNVTFNNLPNVTATTTLSTICAGVQVTLTGGGASTYSWNNNVTDGTAFAPTATTTYIVTGTDANGCADTAQVTVTVNQLPTAVLSGTASICNGDTTDLTVTFTGSSPWTFIGNDGSGDATFTATTSPLLIPAMPNATKTYVAVSVSDANCTGTATGSAVITVNNLPNVIASATSTSICAGETVTLNGNGATTYVWNNSAVNNTAFSPTATQTYMVTGTDANGCSDTALIAVTVKPLPVASVVSFANPATCGAADGQIAVTDDASYTYNWNTASAQTAATATGLVAGHYTVTVTLNSCSINVSKTLNDATAAVVTLSSSDANNSICEGESVTFTANGLTSGTYELYSNNTLIGTTPYTQNTYTTSTLTDGTSIYVKAIEGACTSLTNTITTAVHPLPTGNIATTTATICSGNAAQINFTLTGTAPWNVNGSDGINPIALTINTSPFTLPVSPTQTTTYSLSNITDANGCASQVSSSVLITVNNIPVLTIANPAAVCSPATIDITSNAVITSNTINGILTYWADLAATIPVANPAAMAISGTYYVQSSNGCGNTILPVNVIVNSGAPVLSIVDPSAICEPATIDLTSSSIVTGNTNNGIISYWTDAMGTIAVANPTAVAISGTYFVKTENGCGADTKSVNVTINPAAALTVVDPAAVCATSTVDITTSTVITSNVGTIAYWKDAAATISLLNPTVINTAGTYYIESTNSCGTVIEAVVVSFTNAPVLTITDPSAVCSSSTIDITGASVITGNTNNGTLSYWADAAANTTAIGNPTAISVAGTYYIKSTNNCGSDIMPVVVTFNNAPVLTVVDPTAVCSTSTIDITTSSVITGNTNSGTISYWADATANTTAIGNPTAISVAATYYIKSSNSCGSDIKPVVVSFIEAPVLTIANPAGVCEPGTADITAPAVITSNTNNGALTYWEDVAATTPVADPTAIDISSTFYIKSTNACGFDIEPVVVTISIMPVVDLGIDAALCKNFNEIAVLDAGNAGATYLWSEGSTSQTLTVNSAVESLGVHTYSVTVTNGVCTSVDAINLSVDICGSAPSISSGALISVSPNPTKGKLVISASGLSNESVVSIVNTDGQIIFEENVNGSTFTSNADLSKYPKGIYILKIKNNNFTKVEKIIVQ